MKKNRILYIVLIIYTSLKPFFSFKNYLKNFSLNPLNSIRSDSIKEYANNYSRYESLLSVIFFFAPTIYNHFEYYVFKNKEEQTNTNNEDPLRINPFNWIPRLQNGGEVGGGEGERAGERRDVFKMMWNKIKNLEIGKKINDAYRYEKIIFSNMYAEMNNNEDTFKKSEAFINAIFFRSNLSRFLITVYGLPILFGKTKICYKNATFHENDAKNIFFKKNDLYKKSNDNKKKENIKTLLKNIEEEANKQQMTLKTEGMSIKKIYMDLSQVQNKLEKYIDFINSEENKKEIEEALTNDLLGLNVHPILKDTDTILKYANEILNLEKTIINPNILKSTQLDLEYIKKNNKNNKNTDVNNNNEKYWEEYKNYLDNNSKIKFPYYQYKKMNEQKEKDLLF